MLIDWFTTLAQIANFLILVALLKHFLWKRLVEAIDQRERRIESRMAEADKKQQEAGRLLEQMQEQSAEQERNRNEMMASAQREAEERRNELIQNARESAQNLATRWRQDLEREQAAFLDETRRCAADAILTLTRKALADLACTDVQHAAFEVFLDKLKSVETSTLRELAVGEISVVSPEDLPENEQHQIQSVIEQRLKVPVQTRFVRTPAMAWGIELRSDGRRIGWTPDSYLDSLQGKLREVVEKQTHHQHASLTVG